MADTPSANDQMDLQTFVKKSLVEISQAVYEAQAQCEANSTIVSPVMKYEKKSDGSATIASVTKLPDYPKVMVDFDIAVTSSDKSNKDGGIKVFLGGLNLGGTKGVESEATQLSRIKFSVPVIFSPKFIPRNHD